MNLLEQSILDWQNNTFWVEPVSRSLWEIIGLMK